MNVTRIAPSGTDRWFGDNADELAYEAMKRIDDELYDLIEESLFFVSGYGIPATVRFSYGECAYLVSNA